MMKKTVAALWAVLFLFTLTTQAAGPNGQLAAEFHNQQTGRYEPAQAEQVNLLLNGAPLLGDVPAMIRDDRTLVPVRLVSEALDAQVLWVQETAQTILIRGELTIVLTVGSAQAQVNGQTVDLPDGVPATIARYQGADRTMVPLRFVSEQLGAQVSWDQATYTAGITASTQAEPTPTPVVTPTPTPGITPSPIPSPDVSPTPTPVIKLVTGIQVDAAAGTVLIATDHKAVYQVTDFGDRVAVDIKGATLSVPQAGEVQLPMGTAQVAQVRYAQQDSSFYPGYDGTVRVVLDLQSGNTYSKNVMVKATAAGVLVSTFDADHFLGGFVPTVPLNPLKYTIAIDPGHGGARIGAVYEEVMEKTINLSVSLKLEAILKGYGYNVVMTRRDDTDIDLYARADVANNAKADLFVSLHSNSAVTVPTFTGIYTYYHPNSRRGEVLAQAIQPPVSRVTGAIDRGVKDADFVVLRETDMCAVLVEMGFMTNHEELTNLISDAYQEKLAQGVAEGIVSYLNAQQPG